MKRAIVGLLLASLTGCQSEKESRIEQLRSELNLVRASLNSCDYAKTQLEREQGEVAKAEWDVTAAENMDSIAPEQEAEIRESLGERMGIARSKVDWKGAYQSRAEAGKAKLEGRNYTLELAEQHVQQSCGDADKDRKRAWDLEDEIRRLGGVI